MLFRGPEKPTDCVSVFVNWRDNAFWTEELEQERLDSLRINPDQYRHVWEGEYVTVIEGAYYANAITKAKAEGRISRVTKDELLIHRLFFDIGGTGARADAVSIWVAQFVGREIRMLNYYEAVGQPLATHLAWMRENDYVPKQAQIWLPHDGETNDKVHDVSYASALRDAGYDVQVVPNQGKGAAKARIEAGRRHFPAIWFNEETTTGGLDALGWYHEKKDEARGIGLGPEHDWSSHAADAFGMMCVVAERIQNESKRRVDNPYKAFTEGTWTG
jgi:phage terminase large subunit